MPNRSRTYPARKILTGDEAQQFVDHVLKAYRSSSIRTIAVSTGRSYGAVHRVLATAGVLRPRGYAGRPPEPPHAPA
ncbi:helix-turn-helix domain-containing protein [Streptomyces sp. NPDC005953]|uniref:helix-turn-helix domain-containing protein n=1 Tax=Streptomyces sp. NPDC005953 TaxID=3156719 RepID=UPI0033F49436